MIGSTGDRRGPRALDDVAWFSAKGTHVSNMKSKESILVLNQVWCPFSGTSNLSQVRNLIIVNSEIPKAQILDFLPLS